MFYRKMIKVTVLLGLLFPFLLTGQDLPSGFFDSKYEKLDSVRLMVTYRFQLAPDSTNLSRKFSDLFVLHIGDSISRFQALDRYLQRIERTEALKGRNIRTNEEYNAFILSLPPPRNRTGSFFEVLKNYPEGKITTRDRIFVDPYIYEEDTDVFNWQLTGVEDEYKGYKTIEATARYGGRQWIARFTPEIPVSEGPYKFHGLPGLIVQIRDSERNFAIVMESIEKPTKPEAIKLSLGIRSFETTLEEFIKARTHFSNNASNIIGDFTPDPHTRAVASRTASSRNNYIERSAD